MVSFGPQNFVAQTGPSTSRVQNSLIIKRIYPQLVQVERQFSFLSVKLNTKCVQVETVKKVYRHSNYLSKNHKLTLNMSYIENILLYIKSMLIKG